STAKPEVTDAPLTRGMTASGVSRALHEAVVERIAGAAHGADRVGGAAPVERLAQAADMDVDSAFVDVDVAAPDAVEQLLAREHAAGIFHQEFEQAEFRGAKRNVAAGAGDPLLLTIELDVAR